MGRRGNQGAFSSVANQMELKTGEMPTLAAAASKLGRNQGDINAIVRTGIARRDAPIFSGKCAYQSTSTSLSGQELLVRMPLKFVESAHTMAKLTPLSGQESLARRRLPSWAGGHVTVDGFAPYVALQRIAKIQWCIYRDGHWDPCHKLVPRKLKAEFCIGLSGRVCGREIFRVHKCRKCYYDPEEKKMREEKKAARPKCRIDGCGGNELRSYGLFKNIISKALKTLRHRRRY